MENHSGSSPKVLRKSIKNQDVKAAIEAADKAANKLTSVISKHVISRPENSTEKMLKLSGLDKN